MDQNSNELLTAPDALRARHVGLREQLPVLYDCLTCMLPGPLNHECHLDENMSAAARPAER